MKGLRKMLHENATDFVIIKIISQFPVKPIGTRACKTRTCQGYSYNVFCMLKQNSKSLYNVCQILLRNHIKYFVDNNFSCIHYLPFFNR